VYGTDKTVSPKKNVLGFLINKLKNNEDIQLYEGGLVLRDYMHVDDVSRAIKCIIDSGSENQIYNIATGQPQYFCDIIQLAVDKLPDSKSKILSIETPEFYAKTQAKNFSLNIQKLKEFNFEPNISLSVGIEQLCLN
jgi:nucleoside-diphosphate-sugar epimerase